MDNRDSPGLWALRWSRMASTQARIGQQALAVLDVALRVPCIFIIDAIFNSYYDPGSGWAGAMGKVLVRVMGKHRKVSSPPPTAACRSCERHTTNWQLAYCRRVSRDVSQQCEAMSPVRPSQAGLTTSCSINTRHRYHWRCLNSLF